MTNTVLSLVVLAAVTAAGWRVLRRLRVLALVATVLVLLALTVVFDTLMIRVGLYVYAPDKVLGFDVWGAPLEDLAYPIAAAVGVPVLWTVLGRRHPRPSGGGPQGTGDDPAPDAAAHRDATGPA